MNNKKKIISARVKGNENLAKIYELENTIEELSEKEKDNSDVLNAINKISDDLRKIPAPKVNVEEKKIEFPKKMGVDWENAPKVEIKTEKVEFPKEIKEIPKSLNNIVRHWAKKAKEIVNVKVTNDFIGVRFLRKNNRGGYSEVEPDDLFNVNVAGGGGPANVGVKNSSDNRIDPATEGTLSDIKGLLDTVETKLQSIIENTDTLEINAETINLNTDDLEDKLDTLNTELGKKADLTETQPVEEQNPLDISGLATEATLSQLALEVTNAIDETAYDLNAAAFNETTNITDDFILDSIEFNFSTAEEKTITITTTDGTKIWEDTNTNQHLVIDDINLATNASENVTVAVTQFSSAGTMDCIARVKKGSNTLVGTPNVKIVDSDGNEVAVDSFTKNLGVIVTEHRKIHDGNGYICSGKGTLASGETYYILLRNVAGNYPHIRKYSVTSDDTPVDIYLFKGPTVSDNGTQCSVINLNDNSSNNSNLDIYHDATISDDGTQLEYDLLTSGKNAGGSVTQLTVEYILAPSTDYVIKIVNNSNSEITFSRYLFFYE